METTTSVPTDGASRLANVEQVQPAPGPWYASRKHGFVMTSNYVVIAEIRGRPEQKANALLIAAGPEMIEALKWAEAALAPFSTEPCAKSGMAMIRSAIAKAEGRTP